jgi:hypothetical protein
MKNKELLKLLEQVHNEIGQVEDIDEDSRELLTHLAADIQELLERSEPSAESDLSIQERLQKAIDEFEVSHPTLTNTLSQLSAVLSNAGI